MRQHQSNTGGAEVDFVIHPAQAVAGSIPGPITYPDMTIIDAIFRGENPSQAGYPGAIMVCMKHADGRISTARYVHGEFACESPDDHAQHTYTKVALQVARHDIIELERENTLYFQRLMQISQLTVWQRVKAVFTGFDDADPL